VNPEEKLGRLSTGRLETLAFRAGFFAFAAFVITTAGCGSTARMVKENLDPKPLVANAISKSHLSYRFQRKILPPAFKTRDLAAAAFRREHFNSPDFCSGIRLWPA
jgi:hypothetical protein